MVKSGFEYSSLMEWNETYGNIERTYYHDGEVTSNIASRGAQGNLDKTKVVPVFHLMCLPNFNGYNH